MQFAFQLLHPAPILTRFHSTGRTRLAQTRYRILFPGIQLRRPCSRLQALRVASSIAAVAMTACSRAAAVQRWLPPPGPLARASARQRSNVAVLTPTSRETTSTAELSGGSSRATILSLYACPYRATACYPRPKGSDPIRAATALTQGGSPAAAALVRKSLIEELVYLAMNFS